MTRDDRIAESMQLHLARNGVDASYAAFVRQHLEVPDAKWRFCCSSMCDPCVQRLGAVVDAVRRDLGIDDGPLRDRSA